MEVFIIFSIIITIIMYAVKFSADNPKLEDKEAIEYRKFMNKMNEYKKEEEEFNRFLKKLPKKKDGSLDYTKFSAKERYIYTKRKSTKEVALNDLWMDISSLLDEINALNEKIDTAFGGERLKIRDMIQIKESEFNELLYIYNRDSGKNKTDLLNVNKASSNITSMGKLEEYKKIKKKMESILESNGWNYNDERMSFLDDLPNPKDFMVWYENEEEKRKGKFKRFGCNIGYMYKVIANKNYNDPDAIYGRVYNAYKQNEKILYNVAFNKAVNFHREAHPMQCHSLTEKQIRMIELGEMIPGTIKFFHIRNK